MKKLANAPFYSEMLLNARIFICRIFWRVKSVFMRESGETKSVLRNLNFSLLKALLTIPIFESVATQPRISLKDSCICVCILSPSSAVVIPAYCSG